MSLSEANYQRWLTKVFGYISPNFSRAEPRERAWTYLNQLTNYSGDTQGCRRHVASYARERRADGAQRLLTMARWDHNAVRRDLLNLLMASFGASGGMLYVTEVTFVKRGSKAAAVERQFSTETRRLENCQIAILLFYRTTDGALLLIDCDLYIPMSWARDPERCRKAGIPDERTYRPRSEIALGMIERALGAGLCPQLISCAVSCPNTEVLRRALQAAGVPHFLRLTAADFATLTAGAAPARMLALDVPFDANDSRWTSARRGDAAAVERASAPMEPTYVTYTMSRGRSAEFGYYYGYARGGLSAGPTAQLVTEQSLLSLQWRRTREVIGLDRYEVRSWRGWHRHMTLVMIVDAASELARLKSPHPDRPAAIRGGGYLTREFAVARR